MERALVAGCGYVGSVLARDLADDGREVWGLRRQADVVPEGVRSLAGDVSRPSTLRGRIPEELDLVVYAVSADERTEDAYRTAYVDGLRNLLELLEGAGRFPQRLLYVSSTAVYGDRGGARVDEETPVDPDGFRGRLLLEGEALAAKAEGTCLRLGGIYGPGRTSLIERVRRGEARCPPDGPIYTNRIHRDDAAGMLRHLGGMEEPRTVYLGVDDAPAPLCEVLRWIARRLDVPAPEAATPDRGGGRRRANKRCDSTRILDSGYRLRYPTYREGYGALIRAEN